MTDHCNIQGSPQVPGCLGYRTASCVCTWAVQQPDQLNGSPGTGRELHHDPKSGWPHFVESGSKTPDFGLWPILLHSCELRTHVGLKGDSAKVRTVIFCAGSSARLRSDNCLAKAGSGAQVLRDAKVAETHSLQILPD